MDALVDQAARALASVYIFYTGVLAFTGLFGWHPRAAH
jgi:hypothetical protein